MNMLKLKYAPGWLSWFIFSFWWLLIIFFKSIGDEKSYHRGMALRNKVMGK